MKRVKAIDLLGGTVTVAAVSLGVSHQAVAKWPPVLPQRIADRVLGAYMRKAMPGVVDSLLREPLANTADQNTSASAQGAAAH